MSIVSTLSYWLALLVILLTIIGVAVGHLPLLRMNRATIALTGAILLIVLGAISLEDAFAALDLNTLALLFGMMVLNIHLRQAGFFQLVAQRVVQWACTPWQLLGLVVLAAGVLSALFLNDTIVLVFTPLVLEICILVRQPALPYLMAVATAANVGSTATITGNPQNMLIGMSSGISYRDFALALGPIALIGLLICWLVILLIYRRTLTLMPFQRAVAQEITLARPLLRKSLLATLVMVAALLGGVEPPLAALLAAMILLITRNTDPEAILEQVDWSLLVFFSGLFIVTGALESMGISEQLFALAQPLAQQGVAMLTVVAVVLSNLISNVPAVLLFRPFVPEFPNPPQVWLTLAMATTLAGNLTLLGSVANLIVAESARRQGVNLTFGEYLKAGLPITLLTLLVGSFWLIVRFAN